MKLIYSVVLLIIALSLFAGKKKPASAIAGGELGGAWSGHFTVNQDKTKFPVVLVFKVKGRMMVYEGDTLTGDKTKGTYMVNGSSLYGNYQFIQDGPVVNIEASINAARDSISGNWFSGDQQGKITVQIR